jgi:hypothetical protein
MSWPRLELGPSHIHVRRTPTSANLLNNETDGMDVFWDWIKGIPKNVLNTKIKGKCPRGGALGRQIDRLASLLGDDIKCKCQRLRRRQHHCEFLETTLLYQHGKNRA